MLLITKKCETPIKQTHTKPQELLDFRLTRSSEIIHFNPSIKFRLDFNWMIGLTRLEIYNSGSNITEEIIKFELYKILDSKSGGISYENVRVEIEKLLEISDFPATDLKDEILGPIILEDYKKEI